MTSDHQNETCDVYWGSHGCELPRGHEGDCICDCAFVRCDPGECPAGTPDCTCGAIIPGPPGTTPYYGPDTRFYGDDVEARGLPQVKS